MVCYWDGQLPAAAPRAALSAAMMAPPTVIARNDILPRLKAGDSSYYADWSSS